MGPQGRPSPGSQAVAYQNSTGRLSLGADSDESYSVRALRLKTGRSLSVEKRQQ